MDTSLHKNIVRRFYEEIINTGDVSHLAELVAPECVELDGNVKLQLETKGGGNPPQTITLGVSAEATVPGSKLKLRAEEFRPALQVKGNEITSGSNEPANPAVLMTIWEDGKQVFHGWLFSKFPDMQPFEHPKYRITLIEGVPASYPRERRRDVGEVPKWS